MIESRPVRGVAPPAPASTVVLVVEGAPSVGRLCRDALCGELNVRVVTARNGERTATGVMRGSGLEVI